MVLDEDDEDEEDEDEDEAEEEARARRTKSTVYKRELEDLLEDQKHFLLHAPQPPPFTGPKPPNGRPLC